MPLPTVEELREWFGRLTAEERVCRTMVKDEIHMGMCARPAVGIDRFGGRNALVCEAHKPPNPDNFVRLKNSE